MLLARPPSALRPGMLAVMLVSIVRRVVGLCSQYAWGGIGVALIGTTVCGYYSATHFAINTDINKLIAPKLDWRQREQAYEKQFPGSFGSLTVVVDAPTPELATVATVKLWEELAKRPDLFHAVHQLDRAPFFTK